MAVPQVRVTTVRPRWLRVLEPPRLLSSSLNSSRSQPCGRHFIRLLVFFVCACIAYIVISTVIGLLLYQVSIRLGLQSDTATQLDGHTTLHTVRSLGGEYVRKVTEISIAGSPKGLRVDTSLRTGWPTKCVLFYDTDSGQAQSVSYGQWLASAVAHGRVRLHISTDLCIAFTCLGIMLYSFSRTWIFFARRRRWRCGLCCRCGYPRTDAQLICSECGASLVQPPW